LDIQFEFTAMNQYFVIAKNASIRSVTEREPTFFPPGEVDRRKVRASDARMT
jgi:hypothetical protein